MLERPEFDRAHAGAAKKITEELVRRQVPLIFRPDDYLIANQRGFLHRREALNSGQETVPITDRQPLLQLSRRTRASDGSVT